MRDILDGRLRRVISGHLASTDSMGFNGAFTVTGPKGRLNLVVSDGGEWEHVSISVHRKNRCPTWEEMCFVKDLFWYESEWVVQFHPSSEEYVDCHPYTLHLWQPIGIDFPKPPSNFVGPKKYKWKA